MNVGLRVTLPSRSEGLERDLGRLSELFNEELGKFGRPWLVGEEVSVADAMVAPDSCRCKLYGLELEDSAKGYVDQLFAHLAVQEWVQNGRREIVRETVHEEECRAGGRTYVQVTYQD